MDAGEGVETALDQAHLLLGEGDEQRTAGLLFYDRLISSALFLLLAKEPDGDNVEPEVVSPGGALGDVGFVLAFDRIERLTQFTGEISPFAELSGRALVAMLAGQGMGVGLNVGVAPSSQFLPPDAIDWMAQMLSSPPEEIEMRIAKLAAPRRLPEVLLPALDRKLAMAEGLARMAYLADATYDNGAQGTVLAFVDPLEGAQEALALQVSEALAFSGLDAGVIDVIFLASSNALCAKIARVGLRFDLPQIDSLKPIGAPGMNPDTPPILR